MMSPQYCPHPVPLPSVAYRRLAPLMEAGDTSGVSYGAHTSIRPRGEGDAAHTFCLQC
ncbi:MAG: hypothetical protein MR216_01590 [Bacteroidales bacterium]|nr:hypothetical protein [Bacteroidales bacterium]